MIDTESRSSSPLSSPPIQRRAVRRVVLSPAPAPSEVQRRLEDWGDRFVVGIVDPETFAHELAAEFGRRRRGGRNCLVASISLFEVSGLGERHGLAPMFDLVTEVIAVVTEHLVPTDVVHVAEDGEILVMARESDVTEATERIDAAMRALAGHVFEFAGERRLMTPSGGVATLDDGDGPAEVVRYAVEAREVAAAHLDLRVQRWSPGSPDAATSGRGAAHHRVGHLMRRLRTPFQVVASYAIGLVVPYCVYWLLDHRFGIDITWPVYLFCVAALVVTGTMILIESSLAVRQNAPPEVESYPPATAIICAYLPNEAATIRETIDGFLDNGYAGGLRVIVAYNTPHPMELEQELHELADLHPDLDVVRVEGSTSKAQNVNAVLHLVTGEFTGMFDADHVPQPGSFERAWRWLASGYSVVQGHCLVRNGAESLLARMVAVEFESIYAVAHPGRARLHGFGIFGGSNGYWRTKLLHETRMRGSMLTEDIDSSLRTVERGHTIRSDRDIVSRELGTTTARQLWNQRLRWAQGWFQVTLLHTVRVWRSPGLTMRQRLGASYLLAWREIYPWMSIQVLPLVAYWLVRGDQLSAGWPIFLCATVFVLHVGPVQTWYTYRLADPEIKQHRSWFFAYLVFSTLFYTEFKNAICRVAQIKELLGERAWRVTPRSTAASTIAEPVLGAATVDAPVRAPAAPERGAHLATEAMPPLDDDGDDSTRLPRRVPGATVSALHGLVRPAGFLPLPRRVPGTTLDLDAVGDDRRVAAQQAYLSRRAASGSAPRAGRPTVVSARRHGPLDSVWLPPGVGSAGGPFEEPARELEVATAADA